MPVSKVEALSPGVKIGHYTIESRIGAGGMGEVYRAFDTTLERAVALKVLPPALLTDVERARRFVQEARSASALNHPNIVTIYQIGQDTLINPDGSHATAHYIAMELIEGVTLRTVIANRTPLQRMLEILAQAADGLAKAHAAGIVHRDLKPDNIMVSNDGFAKIVDFGLAKLTEGAKRGDDPGLTQEGMVMGTVGYMSPEQVEGLTLDPRSDIFAFGCILYEASSGKRPFQSDLAIDTLHKIVFAEPEPVRTFSPDCPPALEQLVEHCLRKKREDRVSSIVDVSRRLRAIAGGLGAAAASAEESPTVFVPRAGTISAPASTPAPTPASGNFIRSDGSMSRPAQRRTRRWTFSRMRSLVYKVAVVAVVATGIWIWQTMPDFASLDAEPLQPWVSVGSLPGSFREAVVTAEDPDFYGRLPRRAEYARAILTSSWKERELPKLVSPISVEAAHSLYASGSGNPLQRVRAWVIAFMMERELSRDRILEIYANAGRFGEAEGVTRAADLYFSRKPGRLNRSQAAYIAALAATGRRVAPGEEDPGVEALHKTLMEPRESPARRSSQPADDSPGSSDRQVRSSGKEASSASETTEAEPEPIVAEASDDVSAPTSEPETESQPQ